MMITDTMLLLPLLATSFCCAKPFSPLFIATDDASLTPSVTPSLTPSFTPFVTPFGIRSVVVVSPSAPVSLPVTHFLNRFHTQKKDGSYSFGYAGGPSSRAEVRDKTGRVQGAFNYVDASGRVQTQHYVADADGFRVAATNLPVAPVVRLQAPLPVQETAEVKAERAKLERIVAERKAEAAEKLEEVEEAEEAEEVEGTAEERSERRRRDTSETSNPSKEFDVPASTTLIHAVAPPVYSVHTSLPFTFHSPNPDPNVGLRYVYSALPFVYAPSVSARSEDVDRTFRTKETSPQGVLPALFPVHSNVPVSHSVPVFQPIFHSN